MEVCDILPSDSEEVHVLAVDDSLVDRKVIERLLKISACKGVYVDVFCVCFSVNLCLGFECFICLGNFSHCCGQWN